MNEPNDQSPKDDLEPQGMHPGMMVVLLILGVSIAGIFGWALFF